MARPKDSQPEVRHAEILAAAIALLDEVGPVELSLRKVAARAQLAISTVQYYFPDKRALLDAVLDQPMEDLYALGEEARGQAADGKPPLEILDHVVRQGFVLALRWRVPVRLHQLMILEHGKVGDRRRALENTYLNLIGKFSAAVFQRPEHEGRLLLKSLLFTIGRYVASTDDEMRVFVGASAETPIATVHTQIGDHVATLVSSFVKCAR